MRDIDKVAIDLFKSIVVTEKNGFSTDLVMDGLLVPKNTDSETREYIKRKYGVNGGLLNATFHKSFDVVETASYEQLIIQQIFHYMTTYGTNFESSYIYLPTEELNIPEVNIEKIKLTVIQPITIDEFRDKVKTLVTSGIALSESTMESIIVAWKYVDLKVDDIKNRELMTRLCRVLRLVPSDADSLLRLLLFTATNRSLKIKDKQMFNLLEDKRGWYIPYSLSSAKEVSTLLEVYKTQYGLEPLAEIYNRNKDLIVSLKHKDTPNLNKNINKISKLAKKTPQKHFKDADINHIADPYYSLTSNEIENALDKATVFKLIALKNLIDYKLDNPTHMLYTIRNGKTFVKENKVDLTLGERRRLLERQLIVVDTLSKKCAHKINGKKFYIPSNTYYKLPTSEKRFVEHIPSGSYVEFDKKSTENIILLVSWETECDIDFSLINESGKIGWDGAYRNNSARVYFSGDMTRLDSNGQASEAHKICDNYAGRCSLNIFSNASREKTIPYKFTVIRTENGDDFAEKKTPYIANPNDIVCQFNRTISNDARGEFVANVEITDEKVRVVFESELSANSCTSTWSEYDKAKLECKNQMADLQMDLIDFIKFCGGIVVTDLEELEDEEEVVDFSIENMSKEKILEILS